MSSQKTTATLAPVQSHFLTSPPGGSGTVIHVARLLPGDDLMGGLQAFCRRRGISAGVVLTCVGSTGTTVLRPAGAREGRTFEGKHEIVSLTGLLCGTTTTAGGPGEDSQVSGAGQHLHMSISDERCGVVGGHVLEGCIVRTTAEVAIAEVPSLRFARGKDERTGFKELSIEPATALGGGGSSGSRVQQQQQQQQQAGPRSHSLSSMLMTPVPLLSAVVLSVLGQVLLQVAARRWAARR